MIFTNEIRLASCSVVALCMMSIPTITRGALDFTRPLTLDVPAPAAPSVPPLAKPRKRFSFLHSMTKPASIGVGIASWYGAVLDGHKTASGETFDMNQMTACHRTLPFGTMVRVVDLNSHKSVIVRINDRGVLFADRIIDLSRGAAERLGIRSAGTAKVRVDVLTKQQVADLQKTEIASTQPLENRSSTQ